MNLDHTISTQITQNPQSNSNIILYPQPNEVGPSMITPEIYINENFEDTKAVTTDTKEVISMSIDQLNRILAQNNALDTENQSLKESIQLFQNLQKEIQRGFGVIQVQLDKIYDLLLHKGQQTETTDEVESVKQDDTKIDFPLKSIEELDFLENQLDSKLEKALIRKFSTICGTSGNQKLSKIGLQLVRNIFTDELLCQLSWKGIKGCRKVPFSAYIKTRYLFYKIAHLADSTCTSKEADLFLQNSAIKHSGQRLKRKLSELKKSNPKKTKNEHENKTITDCDKNSQSLNTQNKEVQQNDQGGDKNLKGHNIEEHKENGDQKDEDQTENLEDDTENREDQKENQEDQEEIQENNTENQKLVNIKELTIRDVIKKQMKEGKITNYRQIQDELKDDKSMKIDTPDKSNKASKNVVTLSNVKITNKIITKITRSMYI